MRAEPGRAGRRPGRIHSRRAFDGFWRIAAASTARSNELLAPPPPRVLRLIGAGVSRPAVAHRFANACSDPADLEEWYFDPAKAAVYLESVAVDGSAHD
ncbi:hypothetical protein [Kitasatospora sp. NPDC001132]